MNTSIVHNYIFYDFQCFYFSMPIVIYSFFISQLLKTFFISQIEIFLESSQSGLQHFFTISCSVLYFLLIYFSFAITYKLIPLYQIVNRFGVFKYIIFCYEPKYILS
jgi:hypothetical protein